MLTRLRNASAAHKDSVRLPYSRLTHDIVNVVRTAGYVGPVAVVTDGQKKALEVMLLYAPDGLPRLRGIKRISTPGRRWYVRRSEIPRVLSGLGIAILSTSRGLLTDAEARKRGVGGEVLCTIW